MRKVFLASPREPSGATWLINCFLELGIKTYRNSVEFVWKNNESGRYCLTEREQLLRKWLPALSTYKSFDFRDDIEVEWLHEWPGEKHENHQIIYFIRDPRDSIFSRYKRENPAQSLREFVDFPDVKSLLNKVDNWALFNHFWLSHPTLKIIRFEDYKQSATRTLVEVLDYLNLSYTEDAIRLAVENSTYEKAAECEKEYRSEQLYLEGQEVINRGGKVGEWKKLEDNSWLTEQIEYRCSDLLDKFGYEHSCVATNNTFSSLPNVRTPSFFGDIIFPNGDYLYNKYNDEVNMQRLASLAESICFGGSEGKVRAELKDYEYMALLSGLIELLKQNAHVMSSYLERSPDKVIRVLKNKMRIPSVITRIMNRVKRCIRL